MCLGDLLKRRLKNSTVEKLVHDRIYADWCEQQGERNVTEWLGQVTEWEKDPSKPSPYTVPTSGKTCMPYIALVLIGYAGMSEAVVKKMLLEEDTELDTVMEQDGDQVTAAAMLITLLNAEDQQ